MDGISRRSLIRMALTAPIAGSSLWTAAHAATAPSRLIVGYPAGGTLDTMARHLADAWGRRGQLYLVDNRAGAAGRIATSQLKRERPDGSALLCTHTSALTIYPHVYSKLMYDATTDVVPVSTLVSATCAFAVSSAVPSTVRTLRDYADWIRSGGGGAALFASPAPGSMAHFLGFQFSESAGLKLQHVAYRGSAPAMQDLLGGHIPAYIGFVADFLPYMAQGKIRVLGTTGPQRSRFLPNVPTFTEQGFPRVAGVETYGVFAPPGATPSLVKTMYEAVVAASKDEALRKALEQVGLEVQTLPPADYLQLIQREREAWAPIVRASGFRSDD